MALRYTPFPNLRLDARLDAAEVRQFVLVQSGISVTNPDPGGIPSPPGKPKIVPSPKNLVVKRESRVLLYIEPKRNPNSRTLSHHNP